jgi:hypothetical protein
MPKLLVSILLGILTGAMTGVIIFGLLTLMGVVPSGIIEACWYWFMG